MVVHGSMENTLILQGVIVSQAEGQRSSESAA